MQTVDIANAPIDVTIIGKKYSSSDSVEANNSQSSTDASSKSDAQRFGRDFETEDEFNQWIDSEMLNFDDVYKIAEAYVNRHNEIIKKKVSSDMANNVFKNVAEASRVLLYLIQHDDYKTTWFKEKHFKKDIPQDFVDRCMDDLNNMWECLHAPNQELHFEDGTMMYITKEFLQKYANRIVIAVLRAATQDRTYEYKVHCNLEEYVQLLYQALLVVIKRGNKEHLKTLLYSTMKYMIVMDAITCNGAHARAVKNILLGK